MVCEAFTLPLFLTRKRFAAPRCVFIFGMGVPRLLGLGILRGEHHRHVAALDLGWPFDDGDVLHVFGQTV